MNLLGYWVYILATRSYFLLMRVAAWYHPKAKLAIDGRKNWKNQLLAKSQNLNKQRIWFHCASLGEYEQAKPVMELVRKNKPDISIVVSFFSPSGYEIRKNDTLPDLICYLPFDTFRNANTFIKILQPTQAVFVRYEFWYHYLLALNNKAIPVYLISAHFTPDQAFFKWYGSFYRNILRLFTAVFCQYESDAALLKQIGIHAEQKYGDTRFDRVKKTAEYITPIPEIENFKNNANLLVLGSSYSYEEQIAAEWLTKADSNWKIIVAPHEINEQRIAAIEELFKNYGCIRFSQFKSATDCRVLIIDNIGMLSRIYAYANVSFVGGGFGNKGLHNILEPLAFGCPVIIGPKHKEKFPESVMAEKQGIATTVNNQDEFNFAMQSFISKNSHSLQINNRAKDFIRQYGGISEAIYSHLY